MSEESIRPTMKWILISGIIAVFLGMVFFVLYATYPADYQMAGKLRSRGFDVLYNWEDGSTWKRPTHVSGNDQSIMEDDSRLICQLPRLYALDFVRGDMSGLNLDDIGNCRELRYFRFLDVTGFPAGEIRKLEPCPVTNIVLYHVRLKDADLEAFENFSKLEFLSLEGNAGITDEGLKHFENIPSLKELNLKKTSVTREGAVEFQKKRPDVKIHYE